MKRLGLVGFALTLVAAAGMANAEAVLTLSLDCRDMGGGTWEVDIYAEVSATAPNPGGLAATEFHIYTDDTTGAAAPVEKVPPPGSGKAKITWADNVKLAFSTVSPGLLDYEVLKYPGDNTKWDGDMDAQGAAIGDLANYDWTDLGLAGPTLLGTETWTLTGASAHLAIDVSPVSRYYDWGAPDPYMVEFDSVVGLGCTLGAGGPVNDPPVADADGPYVEGDWVGPPGWNNPARSITLDGSGSSDTDGTIVAWDWDLDNDGLFDDASGENPVVTIGDLAALGIALPAWPGGTIPISLQVTDDDGATGTDGTTLFIPEPATMVLLGLGGLGLLRRRRS